MFEFLNRRRGPVKLASNPGVGIEAKVTFANDFRSWTEEADLLALAREALRTHGHATKRRKGWLEHSESGYQLLPQLVELVPHDNGAVQTVTTMQVHHPDLTPTGLFEYQHSVGDNTKDAVFQGYEQWAQTDFVALLSAWRGSPDDSPMLEMRFGQEAGARIRRAVFGPVMHMMANPPEPTSAADPHVMDSAGRQPTPHEQADARDDGDQHPFCPCCLLTRSIEAFKPLLEQDTFCGLRLYAARDAEGGASADCRVNGEDYEPGIDALRAYAETWPDAGFEFRKQYVVLHSVAPPTTALPPSS